MELYMEMDFEYYDCRVREYNWNEKDHELTLYCLYQDKEKLKAVFKNAVRVKCLEVLPCHVIEYIKHTYDVNTDSMCYEVKCKDLVETATIWADKVLRS